MLLVKLACFLLLFPLPLHRTWQTTPYLHVNIDCIVSCLQILKGNTIVCQLGQNY